MELTPDVVESIRTRMALHVVAGIEDTKGMIESLTGTEAGDYARMEEMVQ